MTTAEPSEPKPSAFAQWSLRSTLYAILFIGYDVISDVVRHHPQTPSRWINSLGMAIVMPWLTKKPFGVWALFLIVMLALSSIGSFVCSLLDISLHVPVAMDSWITSLAWAIMIWPSAVVTEYWLRTHQKKDA